MRRTVFMFFTLLLCCFFSDPTPLCAQVTKVYIVRHAEKDISNPDNHNPELTEAGRQRAQKLVKELRKEKIAAVFSTDTYRTMSTGEPVARKYGLRIETYDIRDLDALAFRIRNEFAGKTVLVVGHSNSLVPTVKALGGISMISVGDNDYDNIFIVSIYGEGVVNTDLKKY